MSDPATTVFRTWRSLAETGEFEPALEALEACVSMLEQGGLSLATMTECYELGLRLSYRCAELIRSAELRITMLDQEYAAKIENASGDESAGHGATTCLDEVD